MSSLFSCKRPTEKIHIEIPFKITYNIQPIYYRIQNYISKLININNINNNKEDNTMKINMVLEDDLHKDIKSKAIELDYTQQELIPVLLRKGLESVKKEKRG